MTFREASIHGVPPVGQEGGKIRIIESNDGRTWSSASLVGIGTDQDLRDPKLSVTAAGQLMLLSASAPLASPYAFWRRRRQTAIACGESGNHPAI